jgi:hypothetical protein
MMDLHTPLGHGKDLVPGQRDPASLVLMIDNHRGLLLLMDVADNSRLKLFNINGSTRLL